MVTFQRIITDGRKVTFFSAVIWPAVEGKQRVEAEISWMRKETNDNNLD
jgi:hypothetical protein